MWSLSRAFHSRRRSTWRQQTVPRSSSSFCPLDGGGSRAGRQPAARARMGVFCCCGRWRSAWVSSRAWQHVSRTTDPNRIEHTVEEMVSQRVLGLAAGYEDLNDHDSLRDDVVFAVAVGKEDVLGEHRE